MVTITILLPGLFLLTLLILGGVFPNSFTSFFLSVASLVALGILLDLQFKQRRKLFELVSNVVKETETTYNEKLEKVMEDFVGFLFDEIEPGSHSKRRHLVLGRVSTNIERFIKEDSEVFKIGEELDLLKTNDLIKGDFILFNKIFDLVYLKKEFIHKSRFEEFWNMDKMLVDFRKIQVLKKTIEEKSQEILDLISEARKDIEDRSVKVVDDEKE